MFRLDLLGAKRLMACSVVALCTALAAAPTHAALFTYTLDHGSYTGTIGLDSFTNASIQVTMTADSDSKVYNSLAFGPFTLPYWAIYGTPSFTITQGATTWSGSLLTTGGNPVAVISANLDPLNPQARNLGFVAIGAASSKGIGITFSEATFYDLSSAYSMLAFPSGSADPLTTSIGDLSITSTAASYATFTVTAATGVPLPMTLALLLGGLGVMVGQRWERRATP